MSEVRESEQAQYIRCVSDPNALVLPADLPLLALRSTIVFPGGRIAVQVASGENLSLLASHPEEDALVCCVLDPEDRDGGPLRAEGRVGVVARLKEKYESESKG